jgi:hypothetical protein
VPYANEGLPYANTGALGGGGKGGPCQTKVGAVPRERWVPERSVGRPCLHWRTQEYSKHQSTSSNERENDRAKAINLELFLEFFLFLELFLGLELDLELELDLGLELDLELFILLFLFMLATNATATAFLFLIKDNLGIGVFTIKGNTCTFSIHSFQHIVDVLVPIFITL